MLLRIWRFTTLLLTALALSLTSAHVLEMPQKLAYPAELYAAVNTTLYRHFATVGGAYSIGAILAAVALVFLLRDRPIARRWTVAGAFFLLLWLASWIALVLPVNGQVAIAIAATPDLVPAIWMEHRARWEWGHALGFVFELLGLCALLVSVLVDTPRARA
jgi:hypothetical protein